VTARCKAPTTIDRNGGDCADPTCRAHQHNEDGPTSTRPPLPCGCDAATTEHTCEPEFDDRGRHIFKLGGRQTAHKQRLCRPEVCGRTPGRPGQSRAATEWRGQIDAEIDAAIERGRL
jgi:hypothetical protein